MMERNIRLAYALAFCRTAWFWLGVWVFFYLQYTDYAGIGLVETVLFISVILLEVPTGALSDLLGKKATIAAGLFIGTIGHFIMAYAPNFPILVFSVFVLAIGGALISGSLEALVYDSLKQEGKEARYDKVFANINSFYFLAPAICGVIGGVLYQISPNLPFIATGIAYGIGFVLSLFLIEPKVDTEKFSIHSFINQTKQGIRELTKTTSIREQTFLLLSIAIIIVIADEMLNSFLGVELGFTATQLGVLWGVIYVVAALASQLSPKIIKTFKGNKAVLLAGCILAVTFLVSPIVGTVLGAGLLLVRSSTQSIFMNITSVIINNNTESKYRATTLSTYNMLVNIPYIFVAYGIGKLADIYSAKMVGFGLGVVIVILLLLHAMSKKKN